MTLLIRLHLIIPLIDVENERGYEFRGHKDFAKAVKQKSQGLPIVANSYQKAGILSFYLKEPITSFNIEGRKNLFGMLDFADSLNGQKIAFVNGHLKGDSIHIKGHERQVTIIENTVLHRNVFIQWLNQKPLKKDINEFQVIVKKLNILKNITQEKESFLLVLIEQNKQVIYRNQLNWKEYDFNKPYSFLAKIDSIDLNKPYKVSFSFITDGMGRWWYEEYLFETNYNK